MSSAMCLRLRRWVSPFKKLQLHHNNLLHPFSYYTTIENNKPNQQPLPPPIQVSLTESTGRGVFATRRIGVGDLIHTAKPLVSHPTYSSLHNVCYFCLKKLSNKAQTIQFCSNECREQAKDFYSVEERVDWSAYDEYCRKQGLKYPLLVKRLACMVASGAASAECLDILQPARLSTEMILKMENEFSLLKSCLMNTDVKDEEMAFLTKQWYIGVLARIRINSFRVELAGGLYEDLFLSAVASVDAEASVGNAVYMLPSFYNHDCDPNIHIVWIENVNARLKALRDIEQGEELRICYIDASLDQNARQTILFEGFGFRCSCSRCVYGD
ncbi:histone-lysine N-methyltransferase ATXR4-like [Thalictrum thalictroides]|uniref:Histone-lysine N-methyltransferase ATXR4-like n=1 Tax=Thalictrum thalictroides TaxID=46969 RepID=A0A7J6WZZ6_THATH|nr:histone-lysine N-methyltransferase ATXR4-like [Thalictrum thalictroides]